MYIAAAAAAAAAAMLSHHGSVTVTPGQTLSGISAAACGTPADYPGLAAASGIADPDMIRAGQQVTLDCRHPARLLAFTAHRPGYSHGTGYTPRHAYGDREPDHDTDDGYHASYYQPRHAYRHHRYYRTAAYASSAYSYSGLEQLWISAGGPASAAPQAARIAQCESGGSASAYNPSGATGVWQILGSVVPGNLRNPVVNARNAVAKYRASGDTFAQWACK